MKQKHFALFLIILGSMLLAACNGVNEEEGVIEASGTISSVQVSIAPEQSGKVLEVLVTEGQVVEEGEALFRLDDALLLAQQQQAQAGVALAQAALDAAQTQLDAAAIQYALVQQSARQQERTLRTGEWQIGLPELFDLPNWYFERDEMLQAAQAAVESARDKLEAEQADLAGVLADASNQDFLAIEDQLAVAQSVYQSARFTLEQAEAATGEKEYLVSAAQKNLDSAEADLEAIQLEYDRLLTTTAASNVLEARARVAVARTMLNNAQDSRDALQTGENSLQVQAAEANVRQAESAWKQAEAGLEQAQATLQLIDLQLEKTEIKAPRDGSILFVNLEAGELVGAGSVVMTLAQMDEVTLTVYVPEDRYGQIQVGQQAAVDIDSQPEKIYTGEVVYIADEAEFTPRNVQTEESRKSTVFAVKISLENPYGELKPGMPADVTIR